ncbi:MAG: class I SAM-dependent methyltransferase [Microcystaceae cyanobacterium]
MTHQTLNLNDALYTYYQAIAYREPPILQELRQFTAQRPGAKMQIAPEQGQFMALLVKLLGAKNLLEIGVFYGYSSLALALALPQDGHLIACDQEIKTTAIAQQFWQKAGVQDQITLKLGPALNTLQELLQTGKNAYFDLIFIDADKRNYDTYYEMSLLLLRPGGLILLDNVLWSGKVADPAIQDPKTQMLRDLNLKLRFDIRVEISLIPIGDGLTLIRKT